MRDQTFEAVYKGQIIRAIRENNEYRYNVKRIKASGPAKSKEDAFRLGAKAVNQHYKEMI